MDFKKTQQESYKKKKKKGRGGVTMEGFLENFKVIKVAPSSPFLAPSQR